jgi:uncharacterized phage protein (TIGR02218 family)
MKTPINYSSPYNVTSLITFLQDPVTLGFAWKLTPAADSILTEPIAATSYKSDHTLPGHGDTVFRSAGGLHEASAIDNESGQEGAGLSFTALFSDDAITASQINAGDWDNARLTVYGFNYKDLRMGQLIEFHGPIGAINEEGVIFTAEARQLTALARNKIGRLACSSCDVKVFGDPVRCKKDLTALTRSGQVVTSIPDAGNAQNTFRASGLSAPTVAYDDGLVIWTAGANLGRKSEIKTYTNATKQIVLHEDLPFAIAAADTFTIKEGCNRTFERCIQYDNAPHFKGQPYITNVEEANRIDRAA